MFRREGEYWTVRYQGSVVRLKDAKGLRHLARLLAHPAREFHAVDLESADSPAALRAATARGRSDELEARADLGDAGELLDATAKAAYRTRIEELRTELEEAEGFNDPARAAKARVELDFLVGRAGAGSGAGRARPAGRGACRAGPAQCDQSHPRRDRQPGPRPPLARPSPRLDHPDRSLLLVHTRPPGSHRVGDLNGSRPRLCEQLCASPERLLGGWTAPVGDARGKEA